MPEDAQKLLDKLFTDVVQLRTNLARHVVPHIVPSIAQNLDGSLTKIEQQILGISAVLAK